MDCPRNRPAATRLLLRVLLPGLALIGSGCAHRREVLYPSGAPVQVRTGRGVHVRAPFVDIQVPEAEPGLDDWDDDDYDDDDD